MLPILIILPLLAAILIIAASGGRRYAYAKYLALAASLASLLMLPLISTGEYNLSWISVGQAYLPISFAIAPINLILLSIVLLVGPLVFLYSFGYMKLPSEQRRFHVEMLAFESAMLVFAMSGNMVTLFIAWEFLSVTSYLLIGFWHRKHAAALAARKAITIILIGDVALVAAIALLWNAAGTLQFSQIGAMMVHGSSLGYPLYAASILIAIAIMTKSAQFPFQEWLPDAMEGPTPVSAFLHSSTMVKAGAFLVIILYPIFQYSGTRWLLFASATITVLISTLNAMKETGIKRILAYSTTQELGLMIMAAASGAILASLYFFIVQSFYKALLFFNAGAVMESTNKNDIREIRGMSSNKAMYLTVIVGVASLAGFFPFSGFFSGTALASSFSLNLYTFAFISLIGFSTSFFIFRWMLFPSRKPEPSQTNQRLNVPRPMLAAMALAAVLALASVAAFFMLPGYINSYSYYLSSFAKASALRLGGFSAATVETVLAVAGASASYLVFRKSLSLRSPEISALVNNSRLFNPLYGFFASGVSWLGDGIKSFDTSLDMLFEHVGSLTLGFGRQARLASSGSINTYVAISAVAIAILLVYVFLLGGMR